MGIIIKVFLVIALAVAAYFLLRMAWAEAKA